MAAPAAPQLPQLPPIDLDQYRWKQSPADLSLWQRRACSTEAIVGVEACNERGEYDLWHSAILQLNDSKLTLKDVQKAAQKAWLVMRYDQPQIACSTTHDGQVKCLVQYKVPKDDDDAQAWANKTILVEASDRSPLDVRDASVKTLLEHGPRSAEATTIYIIASVPDLNAPIGDAELRFVFHSNHLYYDGIGLREMIGMFFRGLAVELGKDPSTKPAAVDWAKSVDNLLPASALLMRADQEISGSSYEAALNEQLGSLFRVMGSHGLQTLEGSDQAQKGIPQTLFHTFTEKESSDMVAAVKAKMGNGHTITHLCFAALSLALVKLNPPSAEGANMFVTTSSISGRQWMAPPYGNNEKPYLAVSQANGVLGLEDLRSYVQPEGQESREKTQELLFKAAKAAKEEFTRTLSRPNQLAISIPTMEMFAAMAFQAVKTGQPGHKVTGPNFGSNGINDRFIPHSCTDASQRTVFTIKDVHFWLNQYPSFCAVRLSSFRGSSRLSVDYNTQWYTGEDMQKFLDAMAGYMLASV